MAASDKDFADKIRVCLSLLSSAEIRDLILYSEILVPFCNEITKILLTIDEIED